MKVGLVGTHAVNGAGGQTRPGADDRLARVAKALVARGADVTVYSCQPDGWPSDSEDVGYRVVSLPCPVNGVDVHDEPEPKCAAAVCTRVRNHLAALRRSRLNWPKAGDLATALISISCAATTHHPPI